MSISPRRTLQRLALVGVGLLSTAFVAQHLSASGGTQTAQAHEKEYEVRTVRADDDVLYERSFAVQRGGDLVVKLGSERVEILRARGREATVTVRGEGRDARSEFERRRFTASRAANALTVRTDPPRSVRMRSRDARFVVTIEIPAEFNGRIDVGSGSVRVDEVVGNLNVNTGSGSVTVGSARGRRIVLDTGSGSIRAESLDGAIRADTGSGAIRIDAVRGSFEGDTGSGSIRVERADVARFSADTGSGAVSAGLWRDAEVDIDTGSGRVELTLPRRARADVDLSGRPIRIDNALGFRGEQRRGDARGEIGGGGPDMDIHTGSGGITLNAR